MEFDQKHLSSSDKSGTLIPNLVFDVKETKKIYYFGDYFCKAKMVEWDQRNSYVLVNFERS